MAIQGTGNMHASPLSVASQQCEFILQRLFHIILTFTAVKPRSQVAYIWKNMSISFKYLKISEIINSCCSALDYSNISLSICRNLVLQPSTVKIMRSIWNLLLRIFEAGRIFENIRTCNSFIHYALNDENIQFVF